MKNAQNRKLYKNELIVAALQQMTVRDLAKKAKVSNATVIWAKRGENLSIKTLRAIARGIGLPVCELVGCEADILPER